MKNERCCSIDKLPIEILVEILLRLPEPDMKNASLVCRSWYIACQTCQNRCLQRDKLSICDHHEPSEVIEMLKECKWPHIHLEFANVGFDFGYLSECWQLLSHRVNRIDFISRQLPSDETMEHILLHCKNIKHLSISDHVNAACTCGKVNEPYSVDQLQLPSQSYFADSLFNGRYYGEHRIRYKNLKTLEIKFKLSRLQRDDLDKMFRVFPNITSLSIYLPATIIRPLDFVLFPKVFSYSDSVLGFSSHRTCSSVYDWKLKEISFQWPDHLSLDFFSKYPDLEVVKCRLLGEHGYLVNEFLQKMLYYCPNLRHIEVMRDLRSKVDALLDEKTFIMLLKCTHLEKLMFYNMNINLRPTLLSRPNLPVNNTLFCLRFSFLESNPEVPEIFLKMFSNLLRLELWCCDFNIDQMLRTISRYQTKLKSLEIDGYRSRDPYRRGKCRPKSGKLLTKPNSKIKMVLQIYDCLRSYMPIMHYPTDYRKIGYSFRKLVNSDVYCNCMEIVSIITMNNA